MTALSESAVQRILGFVGYGNPNAMLWFIGLEEGLGGMDDADVAANLAARGRFDEVMDLSKAHLSLIQAGRPYDLSGRQSFTQVWLWMARLARAIGGASDWQDTDRAKEYIRTHLGRSGGETFLTYASPIPERRLQTRQWTALLQNSGQEMLSVMNKRRARIRALIQERRPAMVICYGTLWQRN